MKGIPKLDGLSKTDIEDHVRRIRDNDGVAECAARSMLFLQHVKQQFRDDKVKTGDDLVSAFLSGLAALNDD